MSSMSPLKTTGEFRRARDPPEHLSEFSSFMNGLPGSSSVNATRLGQYEAINHSANMLLSSAGHGNTSSASRSTSPYAKASAVTTAASGTLGRAYTQSPKNNVIKRRTSLHTLDTFTSFLPSVLDLTHIVTHKDFQETEKKYNSVIRAASRLRGALNEVSKATEEFGKTLEDCVGDYSSKEVCDGLMSAAGLHYMMSLNEQILSRLMLQNFEEPFTKELRQLRLQYDENQRYYEQEIRTRLKELRAKELANLQLSKKKTRNLLSYKNNLVDLTRQVEEIDRLKYDYYREINAELERFAHDFVLPQTGSLVRAQLEVYESFARKGWEGGGLDALLAILPDILAADLPDNNMLPEHDEEEEEEEEAAASGGVSEALAGPPDDERKEERGRSPDDKRKEDTQFPSRKEEGAGPEELTVFPWKEAGHRANEPVNGANERTILDLSNDISNLTIRGAGTVEAEAVENKHKDDFDESFSLPVIDRGLKSLIRGEDDDEKEISSSNILSELGG